MPLQQAQQQRQAGGAPENDRVLEVVGNGVPDEHAPQLLRVATPGTKSGTSDLVLA